MAIWDQIRKGIFNGESGGDYNALFGYANRKGPLAGTRVTDMTIDQVLAFTDPSGPYAQSVKGQIGRVATPVGAYQVVGSTLRDAVKGLGLSGGQIFNQATQDAVGKWVYDTQGTGAWEGYRGPQSGGNTVGLLTMSQPPGMPNNSPQTFGERFKQSWQSGDMLDNLAIGLNSMRMSPDQGLDQRIGAKRQARQSAADTNRTITWLRSLGTVPGNQAAAALEAGSIDASTAVQMGMATDPNIAIDKAAGVTNRTLAWIKTLDTPAAAQAAALLEAGTLDPAAAVKMALEKDPAVNGVEVGGNIINPITGEVIYTGKTEKSKGIEVGGNIVDPQTGAVIYTGPVAPAKPTDDVAEFNLAKQQGYTGTFMEYLEAVKVAGTAPTDNRTELQKRVEYFMGPPFKMTQEKALEQAQAGSGGTTVNVGPTGTDYGNPPPNMAWKRNPDGSVKTDADGMPLAGIIGGTPAANDAAAAVAADASKARNTEVYSDAAIGAIDSLIGADGKPGMLADGGLFSMPQAGIIGSKLADWGINQEAVDVKNTLNTITSNIAFGRLQAMRDASKTGGALGSVSAPELDLLANSLSAVSQNTSPKRLIENLKIIKEIWLKISNDPVASAAYAAAGGGAGGVGTSAPPAPAGDGFAVTGIN